MPSTDFPICEFCQYRKAICEHHLLPKSQLGKDEDKVWLCHACHDEAHRLGTRLFRAKFLSKKAFLSAQEP